MLYAQGLTMRIQFDEEEGLQTLPFLSGPGPDRVSMGCVMNIWLSFVMSL